MYVLEKGRGELHVHRDGLRFEMTEGVPVEVPAWALDAVRVAPGVTVHRPEPEAKGPAKSKEE